MTTHTTTPEMRAAIERLHQLPEAAQARLAPALNDYLTQLEALRDSIRDGDESGPAEPADLDAMFREVRQEWEAARRR